MSIKEFIRITYFDTSNGENTWDEFPIINFLAIRQTEDGHLEEYRRVSLWLDGRLQLVDDDLGIGNTETCHGWYEPPEQRVQYLSGNGFMSEDSISEADFEYMWQQALLVNPLIAKKMEAKRSP